MTERVQYIELDVSRCSLTYGEAPCTAEIGVTGTRKCFNSFATCQDTANYDEETVTERYTTATGDPSLDINAWPMIETVNIRPAELELGESIGVRASINITFSDSRYPDTGPLGDRYLSDRTYDPYTQGTYWGKFRARYPYTKGNDIRLINGSSDQSLAQMETRHFVVETVAGPDSDGVFNMVAKDALKLADGDRAQAPQLSQGYLDADITSGAGSLTLAPTGIGDIDYPSSGTAQIGGKEIVTFTRSGDSVTLTARGVSGTEAQAHDEEDRFQICLTYSGEKSTAIIEDLLLNYANVPSSYIPSSTWESEDDSYIARLYTATIAEPTPVKDLINEILVQTASTLWWDDETRLIRFRVLRDVATTAKTYNDDLIVGGSFQAVDQPDKRVSQVWTYYGQLNPLEDLNDPKNYRSTLVTVDLQSEANFDGVPAIRRIFSRWIPPFARNAAERLNNLVLSRYATPPRMFSFTLQRNELLQRPQLAGGYNIENWTLQDDTGATQPVSAQVVKCRNTDTTHAVMAEEVTYSDTVAPDDPNDRPIIIDTDVNNVNLRDLYDAQYPTPDGSTVVTVTVEAGVIVGSDSVSSYSMRTGSWPESPTLNLVVEGRIQGRGGAGGAGGSIEVGSNGQNGQDGGDALLIEYDCDISGSGEIWSGGGGGGGGGAISVFSDVGIGSAVTAAGGSGGGGGSGRADSLFGVGGSGDSPYGPASGRVIDEVNGNNGQSGTADAQVLLFTSIGGRGGVRVRAETSDDNYALGGRGGSGGPPGGSGFSGGTTLYNSPVTPDEVVQTSPGSGGSPGNAVVESGGTATIGSSLDIEGAVV